MAPKETSWPEIKYPTTRDERIAYSWIKGKQIDDGAEGFWRIHNGLYDLSAFIQDHPGGRMWLELTEGTDITEAFEAHHLTTKPEDILPKFYVRSAKTPRNSPYTFDSNGFYKTLKSKVIRHFRNKLPPVTQYSSLVLDCVVAVALMSSILSAIYDSYCIATFAGILMTMIINCSHNFVHQRDNWRMYYLHLTSFSVREFRITHVLSHHLHTNTMQDLEISLFEPMFQFLPQENKTWCARYLSWIYFPFALLTISMLQLYKRLKSKACTKADLIILTTPILMLIFGNLSFMSTILLWIWIIIIAGAGFGAIGFTAAHHHPVIFHDGDIPRQDRDWGLNQIDAVQDRVEIEGNVFISLLIFGEHTLHHLFPTLDHAVLPQIRLLYTETLEQFGIESNVNTIGELIKGAFKQLARVEKNQKLRKQKRI